MGTMQHPGPHLTFDPSKQSYLEYLNSVTGYGQPSNPFPGETAAPVAQQQQPPKQPNPVTQGVQSGLSTYGAYQAGQGISDAISGGSQVAAQAAPSAAAGAQAVNTIPTSVVPSTPVIAEANVIPTGTSTVPSSTPWFDVGGPSYAGYAGAAASGANIAMNWNKWGDRGEDYRNTRAEQQIAEGVGNVFTGGLAGLANQGIRAIAPHFMNEVDEFATKFGPMGILTRAFGSKKGKDQVARDAVRANAQKNQWFGNNFEVPLEQSGITLDMGKDGGFMYQNQDGSQRPVYNIDWENDPLAEQGVGWLRPLALILSEGDEKLTDDFTAQLYNELTKDGQVKDLGALRKRAVELYNQFKLKPSLVAETINAMGLDPSKRDPALAAIDSLKPGRGFQVKEPQVRPLASHPSMQPKEEKKDMTAPTLKPMGSEIAPQRDPRPQGRPAPEKQEKKNEKPVRGLFIRA